MEKIVADYELLVERAQAAASKFQGHIKVGIGICEYSNTEQYFSRFLKTYPDIKIDIFQYTYSLLTQKFKAGELDFMITLDMSKREFHSDESVSVCLPVRMCLSFPERRQKNMRMYRLRIFYSQNIW
ncbi:MAG: hypothetical protein V8R80_12325 [Eubacterium sp.]